MMNSFFETLRAGGLSMAPLVVCSLAIWWVIVERFIRYRRMKTQLATFHLEALHQLLRGEKQALRAHCSRHLLLPTSELLELALERRQAEDPQLRQNWRNAVDRRRIELNAQLKAKLWILGTVATAAPFIGLFGTVLGILSSFQQMASAGTGGFLTVAAGISEALIATAVGIGVAVVAAIAFNSFQVQVQAWILVIKHQVEEWSEILESTSLEER